jgi:hypothetical protein
LPGNLQTEHTVSIPPSGVLSLTTTPFSLSLSTLCDFCEVRTETRFHFVVVTLCDSCEVRSQSQSKSHYDRQSVGQVLVSGAHLGPATNFSFSLRFSFVQLIGCYFVAPSLLRRRVCNLLLLLISPAQSRQGLPSMTRCRGCLLCLCQYQSIVSQYVHKVFTQDINIICV